MSHDLGQGRGGKPALKTDLFQPVPLLLGLGLLCICAGAIYLLQPEDWNLQAYLNAEMLKAIAVSQIFAILANTCFGLRLVVLAGLPARKWWAGFESVTLSIGLNTILPARLAEFVKPVTLSLRTSASGMAALSALLIERAWDIVILGILALLTLWLFPEIAQTIRHSVLIVLLLAVAFLTVLRMNPTWLDRMLSELESRQKPEGGLRTRLMRLAPELIGSLRVGMNNRRAAAGLLLGILGWANSWMMVAYLLHAMGPIPLSGTQVSVVFIMSLLGGMIAILPAATGTFHAAAAFGMILVGFPEDAAIGLAIGLHIQAFAFAAIFTLGFSLTQGSALRSMLVRIRQKYSQN